MTKTTGGKPNQNNNGQSREIVSKLDPDWGSFKISISYLIGNIQAGINPVNPTTTIVFFPSNIKMIGTTSNLNPKATYHPPNHCIPYPKDIGRGPKPKKKFYPSKRENIYIEQHSKLQTKLEQLIDLLESPQENLTREEKDFVEDAKSKFMYLGLEKVTTYNACVKRYTEIIEEILNPESSTLGLEPGNDPWKLAQLLNENDGITPIP